MRRIAFAIGMAVSLTALAKHEVGVYCDSGPAGIGAYEWFNLVNDSPDMNLTLVDGADVRAGALDKLDVLVMPGGSSPAEYQSLGDRGLEKIRTFIRRGGGYIGTCAGCFLAIDQDKSKDARRMHIAPYCYKAPPKGVVFLNHRFTDAGKAALGVTNDSWIVRFNGGAVMKPSTNRIEGAAFEVWAKYASDGDTRNPVTEANSVSGYDAIVGGTYGCGRVVLIGAHPEYFVGTVGLIDAAFRWVLRDASVKTVRRYRRPGARPVAFVQGGAKDGAKAAVALHSSDLYDVIPIDNQAVSLNALEHVDLVVFAAGRMGFNGRAVRPIFRDYLANGGRAIAHKAGADILREVADALKAPSPAAERERVVIVPAHPDDLISAFGFCLLARGVYDVHVVDYTRGERGMGPVNFTNGVARATRTAEEETVCAELGVKLRWLDQPDGAALVTEEAVDRLSEILDELKPRAVIGHWPADIHGDHTMAGAAMLKAVSNVSTKDYKPEVYFFEQPYQSKAMVPDVYLDVTEVWEKAAEIRRRYVSQGYARRSDDPKKISRRDACGYARGMQTSNLNAAARVEPYRAMFPRQQGQETVFDRLRPCALRPPSRFQGLKTGKWSKGRIGRVETVLKGGWTCDGEAVEIPHTWNACDAADGLGAPANYDPQLLDSSGSPSYLRKRAVYARALPDRRPNRRYFLRCLGASIKAEVRVNGIEVGRHAGPFTAFAFEITSALKPSGNRVEIAVDNRFDPDVQPIHADFSTYGGLYRDVILIETDPVCIDPVTDGARGVRIEADAGTGRVRAFVSVLGGTNEVQEFAFPNPELWSPENPKLYTLDIGITQNGSTDSVRETFGFRTIEFRPDGFYLNGVKRKIRGVNRHQDREGRGWAVSADDETEDIRWIKRMGADGLRTCHYPQSWNLYDLCDREGLLVWTELPNVDGLTFSDAFRSNNCVTAREMVAQNRNHPCIFAWGLFNELYNMKMPAGAAEPEMRALNEFLHGLDPSRKTVAASCDEGYKNLNAIPDEIGFNLYPGWYGGKPEQMSRRIREVLRESGRRQCAVSEYGAGASVTQHADARACNEPAGPFHAEEYQAYVHAANYRVIAESDRVWGSFVWAMFDLGADLRHESDRQGINTKGLVTFDRKTPKDAYWLYRANWRPEPTLHLVGTRLKSLTNACATVLAFSNVGEVTLAVNGKTVGQRTPDAVKTVMWKDVPLAVGPNRIAVTAGGMSREAVWNRKSACQIP